MSAKAIFVWIIVIIVVAIGAYIVITNPFSSQVTAQQPAAATTTAQSATTVQAQDVAVGTGTQAIPGSIVSVLYVGKLPDGTIFDSSAAHGNEPLTFTLGAQGLISGFQIGVNGMKVGGERLMAIPPALGYGAQDVKDGSGKVIIPANSTLVFDVKLVKVAAAAATTSTPAAKKTK